MKSCRSQSLLVLDLTVPFHVSPDDAGGGLGGPNAGAGGPGQPGSPQGGGPDGHGIGGIPPDPSNGGRPNVNIDFVVQLLS
jgi:hypothetical protein